MMILFLIAHSIAMADPVAISVEKGDIVPFSGTLLNKEATAAVLAQSSLEAERCGIVIGLEVKKKSAELQRDIAVLQQKNEICVSSLSTASSSNIDLTKKYNRSISARPYIFSAGLVGGVAMTLLVSLAINGVTK